MAGKRTKHIHQDAFRKCWRIAPIALAISTALMLTGCEKTDETVRLYQNADDCSRSNPGMSEHCVTTYNNALKEAARTAPKYASREDCVAEFGESQCAQTQLPTPVTDSSSTYTSATSTQTSAQSGSFWMPMMAGYMMGRMMSSGGGFMQQPLFTSASTASPANGKFVDASGKSYGPATPGRTITVPKNAMTPKPSVTKTITRGGFGESVARAEQRNKATQTKPGAHRRNMTGG